MEILKGSISGIVCTPQFFCLFCFPDVHMTCLGGLLGKASALRVGDIGVEPHFLRLSMTKKNWYSSGYVAAIHIFMSELELAGLVSVLCDWVWKQVGSAAYISVWQHTHQADLSAYTLMCCCDFQQPIYNNNTHMDPT